MAQYTYIHWKVLLKEQARAQGKYGKNSWKVIYPQD